MPPKRRRPIVRLKPWIFPRHPPEHYPQKRQFVMPVMALEPLKLVKMTAHRLPITPKWPVSVVLRRRVRWGKRIALPQMACVQMLMMGALRPRTHALMLALRGMRQGLRMGSTLLLKGWDLRSHHRQKWIRSQKLPPRKQPLAQRIGQTKPRLQIWRAVPLHASLSHCQKQTIHRHKPKPRPRLRTTPFMMAAPCLKLWCLDPHLLMFWALFGLQSKLWPWLKICVLLQGRWAVITCLVFR